MTPRLRGLPPGRAGRMWLTRRLTVATRGADLLETKLRILLGEEQNYVLLSDRTRVDWAEAAGELERWMLQSALLSGERAVRLACSGTPADVDVLWRMTMGVRYPAAATCTIPARPDSSLAPDNNALRHAVGAADLATRAAVDHAVATAALAAVQAEIVSTRRQLRALRERWIPRLLGALTALTIELDDQEQDEHVRLRWAADRAGEGRNRA